MKWKGTHKLEVDKRTWIINWPKELVKNPPRIKKNVTFMKYPYFEKDIENLAEKGYWVPKEFSKKQWDEWHQKVFGK